jgi:hypothetical protein
MRKLPLVLMFAVLVTTACSKKLQSDSPKRESTGAGSSGSDGYKDANKDTPAAPARTPEQGTGTNTGDTKGNTQPDTESSTPGTDKPGATKHQNETTPPQAKH